MDNYYVCPYCLMAFWRESVECPRCGRDATRYDPETPTSND